MTVRITVMVLRVAGLLALILGLLFWFGSLENLVNIHMLLGIIVTLCLWILGGIMVATRGGRGLGTSAIVLGLVVVLVGLYQRQILLDPSIHWIVQVVHLLLGLSAIGMGEAIAGRFRRLTVATSA